VPETRYARSGDVNIAYQVVGDGPRDLVFVPGWVSNVEVMWEDPGLAHCLERLSSFSRLIVFDKRGTGLSDAVPLDDLPTLETRMDDLRAVMDAAGSESAVVMGHSEGGNMSMVFAATHPARVEGLILIGSYAKRRPSEDYPWAPTPEDRSAEIVEAEESWGDAERRLQIVAPSRAHDEAFRTWLSRYIRLSASPRAAAALLRMNTEIDVTGILGTITASTLLVYRTDDVDVKVEEGRYIASKIPDATIVELPGADHFFWSGDTDSVIDEVEQFVTGHRPAASVQRMLSTVLFTDIVDSTRRAADLGDRAWRDLLARHNAVVRSELQRWRGTEVSTTGDGFLATFDGPARALRCGLAIAGAVKSLGIEVRCGVHTGEVEIVGDDIAGLGVHIGARVMALAGPGEVLASRTVRDLVSGSGLAFDSRGVHELKGVPEPWEIFSVG